MNKKTTVVLLLVLLALPIAASAQERRRGVEIRSYEIALADLDHPETRIADGVRRTFSQVYIVELKGDFGEIGAIPVDVYIGDHKIEEYGGTHDGIYFKVYDEALFDRLEGQPFAYGFEGEKVETLDLRFTARDRRPFKRITWPARPKP